VATDTLVAAGELSVTQLVSDHLDDLYRYAYRLSGSTTDAEDLVQQTFLAAQASLDQLRDARQARGWLCTILRHAFLKSRQKRTPVPASNLGLELDGLEAASIEDDAPIDREELQRALGKLSDEFRVIVLMFYLEECSYREIAERLNLPIGTVMSRLSRAKSQLRRHLFAEPLMAPTTEAGATHTEVVREISHVTRSTYV
jgi:RNA polymerase sigma-70 factor (ECF subfamily)